MRLEHLFDAEFRYTDTAILKAPFGGREEVWFGNGTATFVAEDDRYR